jgi:hypothetical protein
MLEDVGLNGECNTRIVPRVEEALLARDDEPAHACLEVDDELSEGLGGDEPLSRLAPQLRRLA